MRADAHCSPTGSVLPDARTSAFVRPIAGTRGMRRLPFRHSRRDLGVVLGQLAELPEDVLLRRAGRLGDQGRGAEQLSRRVTTAFHLKDAAHLPVRRHVEGDEHDHPSGKHSPEREKMWTHETKVRLVRVERKRRAPRRLRLREGPVILLP
jgi:hypothetical protein